MNSPAQNAFSRNSITDAERECASVSAEETLRLLARLSAPEGLEDRVMASLKTAPRSARVLHWPELFQPTTGWMRGAAAAAIVFVVAGGGWGIVAHVEPGQPARAIATPTRTGGAGGFSSAGAIRKPETLNGPMLTTPVIAPPAIVQPPAAQTVQTKPLKKVPAPITPSTNSKTEAGKQVSEEPAVSAVK
jgi:hypothetical protein